MNKDFFETKVEELKQLGQYRTLNVIEGANDAIEIVNGVEVINLCSNNYLGFANHDRLKKVAIKTIEKFGVGAGAVRTINGNSVLHEELDKKLASFKGEEKAHHFQSGLNCNLGVIPLIAEEGDLILSDEFNHASIIDGTRLSKATRKVYKHANMEHLKTLLKQERSRYKKVLIITDGVFSMDGDIAPLPELVKIAKNYDCLTYVDDAHGSGVLGKNGRGTIDSFNLHGQIDFIVGTLSKAIGSIGGYITGSTASYNLINHRARPILFSTALPPASIAVSIEALTMLEESEQYSTKLWDNTNFFQRELINAGFNLSKTQTPITPIHIGDEATTIEISKALFKEGIYASPIVYPTVGKGKARIRCMVSAAHSTEQLKKAVNAFKKVCSEIKI